MADNGWKRCKSAVSEWKRGMRRTDAVRGVRGHTLRGTCARRWLYFGHFVSPRPSPSPIVKPPHHGGSRGRKHPLDSFPSVSPLECLGGEEQLQRPFHRNVDAEALPSHTSSLHGSDGVLLRAGARARLGTWVTTGEGPR